MKTGKSSSRSTSSSRSASRNKSSKSLNNAGKSAQANKMQTAKQTPGVKSATQTDKATVGVKETSKDLASADAKANSFADAWGANNADEAKTADAKREEAGLDPKSSIDATSKVGAPEQASAVDPKSANAESAAAAKAAEETQTQAPTQTRAEYEAKAEALGTADLAKGAKNNPESVKALQTELAEKLGKDLGGADGKFGPKTEAAVKEFQEQNGLDPSGKFDEKTREALLGDKPARTREELQDKEAERQMDAAKPKDDMIFGDKLSASEQDKVREVAKALGTTPNDLMSVMAVETGGTFDPAEKAKGSKSSAVGLIQFTGTAVTDMNKRRAAEGLPPISKDQLSKMSFTEQMDHVQDYLQDTLKERNFKGEVGRDDLYAAILAPSSLNKSNTAAVYSRGSKAYSANKSLDTNRDGKITRNEMTARVESWYDRGMAGLAG